MIILDLNGIGYDGPQNDLLEKNVAELHIAVIADLKAKGTYTFANEVQGLEKALKAKGLPVEVDPLLAITLIMQRELIA